MEGSGMLSAQEDWELLTLGPSMAKMSVKAQLVQYMLKGSFEDDHFLLSDSNCELDSAVWSGLPAGVVEKVLMKLPSLVKFRFRVVCKEWHKLLSSPEFWQRNVTSSVFCALEFCAAGYWGPPWKLGMMPLSKKRVHRLDLSFLPSKFEDWIEICCVHDGLICLRDYCRRPSNVIAICVINPMTRTWREVPAYSLARQTMDWEVSMEIGKASSSTPTKISFKLFVLVNFEADSPGILRWGFCTYCSTKNSWSFGEGDNWSIEKRLPYVICDGLIYSLSGGASLLGTRNRLLYVGNFVREVPLPFPSLPLQMLVNEIEDTCSFVTCNGEVFMVVLADLGGIGYEIWKLNESHGNLEKFGALPEDLHESLFVKVQKAHDGLSVFYKGAVEIVGDFICIRICIDINSVSFSRMHLVAFHISDKSWHIILDGVWIEDGSGWSRDYRLIRPRLDYFL